MCKGMRFKRIHFRNNKTMLNYHYFSPFSLLVLICCYTIVITILLNPL